MRRPPPPLLPHPLLGPPRHVLDIKKGRGRFPTYQQPICSPLSKTKQALNQPQAIVAAGLGRIGMGKGTGQKVTIPLETS